MLVLDCSVTLAWLLPDETSPYAEAALLELKQSEAIVPPLWVEEVANTLLVSIRRGRISPTHVNDFVIQLNKLGIHVSDEKPEIAHLPILIEMGADYGLSVYDTSYLLLAIGEQAPLATLDKKLANVAKTLGILWHPDQD